MDCDIIDNFKNFNTSTPDEIVQKGICNIELSNKQDSRTEKAQFYFIQIMEYINNKDYHFVKLNFLIKMCGVIKNYHSELFYKDWQNEYYYCVDNISKYTQIKTNMETFIQSYNIDLNKSLLILKNIYISLFKLSDVFPEYYYL